MRRIPINLTPQQTLVVLVIAAGLVLVLLLFAVLELLLTRSAALAVRLSGRRPPRKGPVGVALDELEARIRRSRPPGE